MHRIYGGSFFLVFVILTLIALISAVVWSSYSRQAEILRSQLEHQTFERLSIVARSLGNDIGAEFHLGRYLSGVVTDSIQTATEDRKDKIFAIAEVLQNENEKFSDKFSWEIFDASAIQDLSGQQFDYSILKREQSNLRGFSPEIAQFLVARLVGIMSGLKLSDDSNWIYKHEIEARLDEKTGSDQARFLCSAVGTFQHLIVDDSDYHLLFIPIFSKDWKKGTDWLNQTSADAALRESRKRLEMVVVLAYDKENFSAALKARFLRSLQTNLLCDKLVIAFNDNSVRNSWNIPPEFKYDQGFISLLENYRPGEMSRHGWIKVDTVIPGSNVKKAIIASKAEEKNNTLQNLEKIVFLGLMVWVTSIIFICGQHILLEKPLNLSLQHQLVIVGFAFLLPVFLLGILTGERYFASRSTAFIQQIKKMAEHSVIEMDSSVQMHQSALCRTLESAANSTFASASSSFRFDMSRDEKHEILGKFLKQVGTTGLVMRNLMVVERNGEVNARLRGSSQSEDRFFRELCSSIFLPVLRIMHAGTSSVKENDQKDVMLKAQADEMLDAMKNMVSPYFFLKMSYLPVLLSQLEGLGDRAFLYHRYLGFVDKPDAVMMMSLYPPSLDSRAMEMWVANFDEKLLSGAQWLMQYKDTPGWYIRRPFVNTPREGMMGLLRFDFDLLPADLSYWTVFSGMNKEPVVLTVSWQNQDWLLATIPGKNLIDYQISLMLPLGSHYRKMAEFKLIFQSGLAAIFVLCLLLGNYMAASFLKPVKAFAATANSFMNGKLSARLPEDGYDLEFSLIAREFNKVASDVESGRILRSFVSEDALRVINLDQENRFAKSVRSQNAIVFFVRLADFFDFSTENSSEEALAELNSFFSILCQEVCRVGGEINKFIGEKAMGNIFFSDVKDQSFKTMALIRAMAGTAARYRLTSGGCRLRAGICTGVVRSGFIGTEDVRLEQTVIGDTVNLAARLCALESPFTVLVCENTAACIADSVETAGEINLEKLASQCIKGKKKNVDVFAIRG